MKRKKTIIGKIIENISKAKSGTIVFSMLLGGILSIMASMIVSFSTVWAIVTMLLCAIFLSYFLYLTHVFHDRYEINIKQSSASEEEIIEASKESALKKINCIAYFIDKTKETNKEKKANCYNGICFSLLLLSVVSFILSICLMRKEQKTDLQNKKDTKDKIECLEQKVDSLHMLQQETNKKLLQIKNSQDSTTLTLREIKSQKKIKK